MAATIKRRQKEEPAGARHRRCHAFPDEHHGYGQQPTPCWSRDVSDKRRGWRQCGRCQCPRPRGTGGVGGAPQYAVIADPDHDYVEPNAGQPATYDIARSNLRSTPSYANPSFAYATAVPNPSRDAADHAPAEESAYGAVVDMSITVPTPAVNRATPGSATVAPAAAAPAETHYSLYGGGGASTTTVYSLYQVLATPNTQRAKDDQGYVMQPNHAIISQASAGHIYAIPMAVDDSNV